MMVKCHGSISVGIVTSHVFSFDMFMLRKQYNPFEPYQNDGTPNLVKSDVLHPVEVAACSLMYRISPS